MSYVCFNCGKGKLNGNLVSHAKNRTKRKFRPNLHAFWVMVGNKNTRAKFCAKCLRRVKAKVSKVSKVPQVSQV